MEPFSIITSPVVLLPADDVDTDQIIPARYLKVTDKAGLGEALFADWRYLSDGSANPEFVLNQAGAAGAQILLAGNNFGCGSSREHAPWALMGFGFKVVISTAFADIFRNNALKNGLLPVLVPQEVHTMYLEAFGTAPSMQMRVDLQNQWLELPDGVKVQFPIDAFSKHCLLNGVDELGYLLGKDAEIQAYETRIGVG